MIDGRTWVGLGAKDVYGAAQEAMLIPVVQKPRLST